MQKTSNGSRDNWSDFDTVNQWNENNIEEVYKGLF